MPASKALAPALGLVACLVLLGVSSAGMVRRVVVWNEQNNNAEHPGSYHFERNVDWSPKLTVPAFAGGVLRLIEPKGDAGPPADGGRGASALVPITVEWSAGEKSSRREFTVIAPPVRGFKDLSGYEESFAVLMFVPVVRGELQGADRARAVIVNRRTDYDPATWGAVRVKDWWFEFVELLPTGELGPTRLMQFPAPRDPQGRAPALIPDKETGLVPNPAIETIRERSWEWTAALHAVPKGQVSRLRFKNTAVSAMGWTLPTSGGALLGAIVFAGLLLSTRVVRRTAPAPVVAN